MKIIMVIVIWAFALMFVASGCSKSLQDEYNQSVTIMCQNGQGSGTMDGTNILTCFHVIQGCETVLVMMSNNRGLLRCQVTYTNELTDVAVLTPLRPITSKKWKRTKVERNDNVYTISSPLGEPFVYARGYVMRNNSYLMGKSYICVDLPVAKGSSGAGVFHNGKLVGLVSATKFIGDVSYVIPIDCVP